MQIITPLVQFQQQLRIFHWQTDSYAQHRAFGSAYEDLDDLIDTFVETFMGIFGKSQPANNFEFSLVPLDNLETVDRVLYIFENYLKEMNDELEDYTDLLNIRDSILGEVNKLRYLLTLK
jgi:DNA-binding ferritin-like protein